MHRPRPRGSNTPVNALFTELIGAEMPLDQVVILDRARPLHITRITETRIIAAVSVDWLRRQSSEQTAAVLDRHFSAAERSFAAGLTVPKRRFEWLAGRLAAKHAVRVYRRRRFGVSQPTRDIVVRAISEGPCAGKPIVDDRAGIGISHSGDFAVGVCTPGPVGIDLERTRRLAPMLVEAMHSHGTLDARLTTMPSALRWACREAVLKYFGFGLRVDPREIELTAWHPDGWFGWGAGPALRRSAAGMRWPDRAWAGQVASYSLALVW